MVERRRYDSPVRRRQVADTRHRIVAAGSALVHELPSWDWRELTFRAVAERAGVGERTVYRHFPTERQLHDAVMQRLEEEAGVVYEGLTLDRLPSITTRIFDSLHAFAVRETVPTPGDDPTFVDADVRRKAALLAAVVDAAPGWTPTQQETAAALLDVVWNLPSYERLVGAWRFDADRATSSLLWLIDRVVTSIAEDSPPG